MRQAGKRAIVAVALMACAGCAAGEAQNAPAPYKLGMFQEGARTFAGLVVGDALVVDLSRANVNAPATLQELEGRSLRLHTALQAGSERVELLRARLRELDEREPRRALPAGGPEGAVVAALQRVHHARMIRASDMLLERASRFVCRISGSRILAITRDGDRVRLQADGRLV